MGIFDSLGDLWSWLTTQSPGGSAGGTPYLGAGSPTASTQTPSLGGAPAGGGGLSSGLLGGQQPVNPMSYFQPQGGGLLGFGNTPLGGMIRGGLEGLGSAQGVGGLSGVGAAAMGAGQAELQRRQAQMQAVMAGQQYQKGQYGLVGDVLQNQQMLQMINYRRHLAGQSPVTMDQVLADPTLAQTNMPGQVVATAAPATTTPAVGAMGVPIVPTAPGVNPNVASAYGVSPVAGMSGSDIVKQYPNAIDAPRDVQDQAAIAFYRKYGGAPWRASQPQGTPVDPVPPASMSDDEIRSRLAPIMARESGGQNVPNAQGGPASGFYQFLPGSWKEAVQLAYPGAGKASAQQPTMAAAGTGQAQQPATSAPQSLPMTIPEIEASNLPDWAKMSLENALYSADPAEISKAYSTVGQYLAAPGQAAATAVTTEQLTDPLKYGSQQEQYNRAIKIRDDYQANKTVQSYAIAKPAADAFEQAYQSRGTPGGSSDYAMVEAALQVLNPNVAVAKPGTAEFATQLQTLPGQVAESIQKAFSTKSAIDDGPAAQLKQAVEQRMAINDKLISSVNKSFAARAKTDAPQIDSSYWNPEGWGSDQGGTTQTGQSGTQTTGVPNTKGQQQAAAPRPWPQDHPATIAAGATPDAEIAWIDSLPIGSYFKNPADGKIVQKRQQRSGYTGTGQSSGYQGP